MFGLAHLAATRPQETIEKKINRRQGRGEPRVPDIQ